MKTPRSHRAITAIEAVVAAGCSLVLFSCLVAMRGQDDSPRLHPRGMKDGRTLTSLHEVFDIFAQGSKGNFPRPGLINRLPDPQFGNVPGFGEEDEKQNTTANLYSCLIAQAYINPDLVISPVERNPKVTEDKDYNMDAYQPVQDSYWDSTFSADLNNGSNTSYAHVPIVGDWKRRWFDSNDAKFPSLSNRGPEDGRPNPESFTCSPHGLWSGWLLFHDGHSEFLTSVEMNGDNAFAMEDDHPGKGVFLTFTKENGEKPVYQFD